MNEEAPAADGSAWALVVIHYRDPGAVHRLLAERASWTSAPALTVVVDNSGDLTGTDASVLIDRPGANLGYAGAANRGVGAATASVPGLRRVLVCTQDASLEPDAAAGMLTALDRDPAAAVSGPLLAYASRRDTIFSAGGRLSADGIGRHPEQGSPITRLSRGTVEVDWLDGAVLMLDTVALRAVGGFDARYFLYVEEIDLQTRLRLAGRRVLVNRDVIAYQEPGGYPTYLKYRNGVYFTRKLGHRLHRWPVARQFVRDSVRAAVGRRRFAPLWACRGVVDGMRGRMGVPPARLLARPSEVPDGI